MVRHLAPVAVILGLLAVPPAAGAAPPPNDGRASATPVTSLPATLAGDTTEATAEPAEPAPGPSVWYRYQAAASGRLIATLAAGGDLEASLELYLLRRSTATLLDAEATDADGRASATSAVRAGQVVLVRVVQRPGSVAGPFSLTLNAAAPAVRPPGPALPAGGITAVLDRVLKPADAWSLRMEAGRTYRIAMVPRQRAIPGPVDPEDPEAEPEAVVPPCRATLGLYAPGTRSFSGASPVRLLRCDGYTLFTPGRRESGRYSLRAAVPSSARGAQRFRLQVRRADASDTAPGVFLANHRPVRAGLRGSGIDRIDLYRFQIAERSMLKLSLRGPDGVQLRLRNDRGRLVQAASGGELRRVLARGRYFVTLAAPAGVDGRYTLERSSRTITRSRIAISGVARARARSGQTVRVDVRTSPGVGGRVRITLQRLDPEAGWLYLRTENVRAAGGRAQAGFRPPSVGRFRARAEYLGTRDAAPSDTGFAQVLVTAR